ncbi:NAD(P)-binding protein [Auriculariales sp. MPI-PUGE-AT-0066]|nr:NAD(P)-binding protein [Auriculariales sp. MPI-PUGE-AT-0066]
MTVGIAILGAGIFAKEAHLPALLPLVTSGEANLAAVYSRSAKTAQSFADAWKEALPNAPPLPVYSDDSGGDHDLDALLKRSDVHAVAIVLPIPAQPDVVRKALAAGKHVLSEKPVAKDVATGIQLIKDYESGFKGKGLIWRVAENYEVEPGYLRARQAVLDGSIGEVVLFNLSAVNYIDETGKYYKTPWRTVPEASGFLLDGGVHQAAVVRLILAEQHAPAFLTGHATLTKKYLAPHDTIHAVFKTKSGATGVIELSFAAPQPSRSSTNITVTGTKGWVRIEGVKVDVEGVQKPAVRVTIRKLVPAPTDVDAHATKEETQSWDELHVGVRNEFASFVAAVAKKPDSSKIGDMTVGEPRAMLRDVAFIQAALTSDGKQVSFDELLHGL